MYFSYIFNVDRLVFFSLDIDDVQDSLFCNNTTGHNMRHVESRDAKETEASINISLPFFHPRSDITHTGKLIATRSALQQLRAPIFLLPCRLHVSIALGFHFTSFRRLVQKCAHDCVRHLCKWHFNTISGHEHYQVSAKLAQTLFWVLCSTRSTRRYFK